MPTHSLSRLVCHPYVVVSLYGLILSLDVVNEQAEEQSHSRGRVTVSESNHSGLARERSRSIPNIFLSAPL